MSESPPSSHYGHSEKPSEHETGDHACHHHGHHGHGGHHARPKHDPADVPSDAKWTCPMHPEIVRDGPGSCPICGMALEPMMVTADEGPNPEYIDMRRRFVVGLVLTIPVFVLAMGRDMLGFDKIIPPGVALWVEAVLATPVVLWGGWPFFVRGWQSLLSRNLNMFTLIGLGTGAAYLFSIVALLMPASGLSVRSSSSRV